MNRGLEAIALAAVRECERQRVGEAALIRLLTAHHTLVEWGDVMLTLDHVLELAAIVEPVNKLGVRRTPVTFTDGGRSTPWQQLPAAMGRLFDHVATADPDSFTHALLDHHPWQDGNGRVAWLVWNQLRGTLLAPDPLPEFSFL